MSELVYLARQRKEMQIHGLLQVSTRHILVIVTLLTVLLIFLVFWVLRSINHTDCLKNHPPSKFNCSCSKMQPATRHASLLRSSNLTRQSAKLDVCSSLTPTSVNSIRPTHAAQDYAETWTANCSSLSTDSCLRVPAPQQGGAHRGYFKST